MVGSLPQRLTLEQMQLRWASVLTPLLQSPLAAPTLLEKVSLLSGANTVPHLLNRKLRGWYVVRMRGNFAQLYDTQDDNAHPDVTLLLNASADVVVDLVVF